MVSPYAFFCKLLNRGVDFYHSFNRSANAGSNESSNSANLVNSDRLLSDEEADRLRKRAGIPTDSKFKKVCSKNDTSSDGAPGQDSSAESTSDASAKKGWMRAAWDRVCNAAPVKWIRGSSPENMSEIRDRLPESPDGSDEKGFIGSAWDWICDAAKGAYSHVTGAVKGAYSHVTGAEKAMPIPEDSVVEEEAQVKIDKLYEDFGIVKGEIKYDRNFLSSKSNPEDDWKFFMQSRDPSIMLMFFILKLHKAGDDNCQQAFKAWLRESEKTKIMAEKKLLLAQHKADIDMKIAKYSATTGTIISTAGAVLGLGAAFVGLVPASLTALATAIASSKFASGLFDGVKKLFVKNPETLVNMMANREAAGDAANIDMLNTLINLSQSKASMIAQDVVRLMQTLSTLISLLMTVMQNRHERLSSLSRISH
jgi:hypothetical protein